MNHVVDILMNRDDLTKNEAESLVQDVRSMCNEAIESGRYFEVEDIIASELGLEPDYMFDVLGI